MKKGILLLFVLGFVVSCGSTKTIRTSKKVIKGAWMLNSVNYSDYGSFRITFFDGISKDCIEGSQWNFVPNNNTGIYTIEKSNCTANTQNFVFTIQEVDPTSGLYDFLLKPTDKKGKSTDNKGFRLSLTQLSDTNMQWEQRATIDGKTININMNFSKITE